MKTTATNSKGGGTMATAAKRATGHQWGLQIRREFDVLVRATEGVGVSQLILAISTEATLADNGTLEDSTGVKGYAWNPLAQERGKSADPVRQRILAASASLGRVLAGGHPTHRAYTAILEGILQVTFTQEYDVTERVQRLWAMQEQVEDERVEIPAMPMRDREPLWRRILHWLAGLLGGPVYEEGNGNG